MCFGSKSKPAPAALPPPAPVPVNDPIPHAKFDAAQKAAETTSTDTRSTSGGTGLNLTI